MALAELSISLRRRWLITAIVIVLLLHLISIPGVVPVNGYTQGGIAPRIFAVGIAVFTLLTIAGMWLQKPWAPWSTLVLLSLKATLDLFAWATGADRALTPVSGILLVIAAVLVFRLGSPLGPRVIVYQRVLFGLVLSFAAWVAVWGLIFPARIGTALPLAVAPLHARVLGAMYLSGCVFMLLGMLARDWHEVRVVTLILAAWTGMLGFVSALNLSVFDWSRNTTWFWFVAYIGYPLIALWIAWCQRKETASPAHGGISNGLRAYLYAQGAIAVVLALGLVIAPRTMAAVWPWPLPVVMAQLYGAPFLSYGLGSLYAARQGTWSEVRIAIIGTLVFTLGVLIASMLHANLFNSRTPSTWLWFGGFGLASLVMLLFFAVPSLRLRSAASAA